MSRPRRARIVSGEVVAPQLLGAVGVAGADRLDEPGVGALVVVVGGGDPSLLDVGESPLVGERDLLQHGPQQRQRADAAELDDGSVEGGDGEG